MLTGSLLLILLIGGIYLFLRSGASLPSDTDDIIAKVLTSNEEYQLQGKTGYADSSGIKIWYNLLPCKGEKKGTVVLVMGHSTNIFGWPDYFNEVFVNGGYDVIRYDNRGIGMSDWMKGWNKNNAYSLEDMATDCIAVLDEVGVEKVHLVGASMGGMIAQRLAISHSDRFLTLTSIMSSGYMNDPELTLLPKPFQRGLSRIFGKYGWRANKHNSIKIAVSIIKLLRNNENHSIDVNDIAQKLKYDNKHRRGFNRGVVRQHSEAIKVSGSRYDELDQITIPTLIIHGKNDPLVKFEHALKYAPMIPHAETLYLDTMGHDLPIELNDQITSAILEMISPSVLAE